MRNDNTQCSTSKRRVFYPSSPNANTSKKASTRTSTDGDDDDNSSSRSSIPNTTYHTGLLEPISSDNNMASSPILDQSSDHDQLIYNHYDTPMGQQRNRYQPTQSSPPPYQEHNASVPLLAAQEDNNDDQENTETSSDATTPPSKTTASIKQLNVNYLYYAAPRNAYFSPWWFTISLFFFVVGLTFVITSIIMVRQCGYVCFEAETENKPSGSFDESEIERLCGRRCHSGSPEAIQDIGAAITGVAGVASVIQLFLLSMWQIHLCCLTCRK
ncbi:hypothetical protein BDA99DRAFT_517414 [Phascolomyces articulosus]|uniref:Uncharacterized protein n=1 Tax=Phascolomyces articulosus TaxID=60185 RepID=A0AAD5JV28_9FUNG|nr:hypothetical protein BDA99DRAFT_517414 [Phascolomyces articulosus]